MSNTAIGKAYDVVVVGSGLAALSLSRLIALELSGVTILTVDKASGPARKVGESTVEIGSHFLHTRLQLADVLAKTQLPKHGLRYWFDDAEHTQTFERASEDGPATFSYWRNYQLERETLEQTLVDLNRDAPGVLNVFGARGVEAEPGDGTPARPHKVRFSLGGQRHEVTSRWLIDGTGPRSLLGRAAGNLTRDTRLTHSSCWTWFEGARSPDEFVVMSQSRRICYGPRVLSTNHLLNEGYWVWMIPLASGLLSVGLVYDDQILKDAPQTRDAFVEFLMGHRMARDLLGDATPKEFRVLKNYSFAPTQIITPERVAYLGMACGFADPFYSNGVDIIALGCESVVDLIRRETPGAALEPERLAAYNRTIALFYDSVVTDVAGLYGTLASHELNVIRTRRDTHEYWNLYARGYMSGKLFDMEFLPGFHEVAQETIDRSAFFTRLLEYTYARLKGRGDLYRWNQGRYVFNSLGFRNVPFLRCEQHLGQAPDLDCCRQAVRDMEVASFLGLFDALFDADRSPQRGLMFDAIRGPVYEGLRALEAREGGFSDRFWEEAFIMIGGGLRRALAKEGVELGELRLGSKDFDGLLKTLLARCADDEQRQRLRTCYFRLPDLEEDTHAAPSRAEVQAPVAWSTDHTPWLDSVPEFKTVYDLLGDAWWRDESKPLSSLLLKKDA